MLELDVETFEGITESFRVSFSHRFLRKGHRNRVFLRCLGYWTHTQDGSEFDCDYPGAGRFGCEDCLVNRGDMDPRTGCAVRTPIRMRRLRRRPGATTKP